MTQIKIWNIPSPPKIPLCSFPGVTPPHPEVITVLSSSPKIDFVCSQDFTEPEPYDTTCSVCSFVSGFSLSMCPKDSP